MCSDVMELWKDLCRADGFDSSPFVDFCFAVSYAVDTYA